MKIRSDQVMDIVNGRMWKIHQLKDMIMKKGRRKNQDVTVWCTTAPDRRRTTRGTAWS